MEYALVVIKKFMLAQGHKGFLIQFLQIIL
jgi:hypothetical protein